MIIVGMDPGNSQFGLTIVKVDLPMFQTDFSSLTAEQCMLSYVDILLCTCINLSDLLHNCPSYNRKKNNNHPQCTLYHTNNMIDKIQHLLQTFPQIKTADMVVIELQPMVGFVDIVNLFLSFLDREKVILIHPTTRNNLGHLNIIASYDPQIRRMNRKREVVNQVLSFVPWQKICNHSSCGCRKILIDQHKLINLENITDSQILDKIGDQKWQVWREVMMVNHHDQMDSLYLIYMYVSTTLLPQWKKSNGVTKENKFQKINEKVTHNQTIISGGVNFFKQFAFESSRSCHVESRKIKEIAQ